MGPEEKMNTVLQRIQIPLKVAWTPSNTYEQHAKIDLEKGLIVLYDKEEHEAWRSLFHECLEYRLRSIISPYREIINKLIETIEQITYREKEKVIDQVLSDFYTWKEQPYLLPAHNPKKVGEKKK